MNQVFYNESDRIVWEEDLEDFIPYKIFDAHVHFWDDSFLPLKDPQRNNFVNSDLQITERWNKQMFPGRDFDYLVFGMPLVNADIKANNEFVVSELAGKPNSRKNRLVTPECKTEDIYNDVVKYNFVGMKPYRQFSTTGDINQCRIQDFLTHPQMELANEMGLFITSLSRVCG